MFLPGRIGRSIPTGSMCNISWHSHFRSRWQLLDVQRLFLPKKEKKVLKFT